jgi:uncharacterized protein
MLIEVRMPNEEEISFMTKQPTWSCDSKTFPWTYREQETCLILEGEVNVKSENQEVSFSAGDFVVFPAGLECVWEVKEPVKKHYKFGG